MKSFCVSSATRLQRSKVLQLKLPQHLLLCIPLKNLENLVSHCEKNFLHLALMFKFSAVNAVFSVANFCRY